MESLGQVKHDLVARAESATLDDLEQRGRSKVRVLRAGQIVEVVDQAISRAVDSSDLIPRDEVEVLVEQARGEVHLELDDRTRELDALRAELEEQKGAADSSEEHRAENERLKTELESANERLAHFEALFPGGTPAAAAAAPTPQAPPEPPQVDTSAASNALASAVDQLQEAMNDRLDNMSKKLGISTAVEADEVQLDKLFASDDGDEPTESNIDDMQVKKTTSGGIGANLERLKKLKGGD